MADFQTMLLSIGLYKICIVIDTRRILFKCYNKLCLNYNFFLIKLRMPIPSTSQII